MKMVPYDVTKIKGRALYNKTQNQKLLEEFASSDHDCVKIEEFSHCDAHVCASSLNNSVKVYRIHDVRAVVREGEVYLVRPSKLK